jgi:hypothetical protein
MDAERDVKLSEPARAPWSTPVLRLLSAVDAEASEGLVIDGPGSS